MQQQERRPAPAHRGLDAGAHGLNLADLEARKKALEGIALPVGSLFESAAICEDIDEMQASPKLHPADPLARAQHRAWMEFGSAVLAELWELEASLVAQT